MIQDCSEALKYNSKYIKALHRRAKAYQVTKELESCLEDITAVCILEVMVYFFSFTVVSNLFIFIYSLQGFQNQSSLLMADRVLKDLG